MLFGFILDRMSHACGSYPTVYVLVDNRGDSHQPGQSWTPNYSIGLQWQPMVVTAVLACRALLESSVTWCTSPLAKPVVFTWSTPHGQAPLSWQLFAWSFLVSTLCSSIADCVPVTLFEVEDLWQEAQRLQHGGFPGPVPTSSWAGGLNS